jgi:hypothetical protein
LWANQKTKSPNARSANCCKDAAISSADDLVKTNKSGDVKLNEEELKRVSGGSLNFTKKSVTYTSSDPTTGTDGDKK